jgi:uncharacterized surface protein with fasciclin (FAS1) repeats
MLFLKQKNAWYVIISCDENILAYTKLIITKNLKMRKLILISGIFISLFMISCRKQADLQTGAEVPTATNTIASIINNPSFTLTIPENGEATARGAAGRQVRFNFLAAALAHTGLTKTLATYDGNYTLFAPTNDAFIAAGFNSVQAIMSTPVEVLKPVLLYHVLGIKVMTANVPAGPNAAVATLNGADLYATRKPDGSVFINGTPVIFADVNAVNGVIHVIDKVLLPPTGNIVQTAVAANPEFTYLVAAVLRASQGGTNVAALLSSNGPFTVFAPVNQAFINAGFPTIAAIMSADPDALTPILAYHVIGARVFSSDLVNGMTPNMLAGGTTTITLAGGAKIKGNGNTTASNIVKTDIVSTNGVIHVIDAVLLP